MKWEIVKKEPVNTDGLLDAFVIYNCEGRLCVQLEYEDKGKDKCYILTRHTEHCEEDTLDASNLWLLTFSPVKNSHIEEIRIFDVSETPLPG